MLGGFGSLDAAAVVAVVVDGGWGGKDTPRRKCLVVFA